MMTKYNIILSKAFKKKRKKLENAHKKRIEKSILLLSFGLFEKLDIKELHPKGNNLFRLRIGKYRIIYEKDNDLYIIYFLDIGSRGDIYN